MPTPTRRFGAGPSKGAVTKTKQTPKGQKKQQTMTSMVKGTAGSSPASGRNKDKIVLAAKGPPNKSILNFFKKVPPPEESMFVAGSGLAVANLGLASQEDQENREEAAEAEVVEELHDSSSRYNECSGPVKRRRLSEEPRSDPAKPKRGPFIDDSDEEDEGDEEETKQDDKPTHHDITLSPRRLETHTSFEESFMIQKGAVETMDEKTADPIDSLDADFADFADLLDDDDDFAFSMAGEEFRERKYMEAQARLEAEAIVIEDGIEESGGTDGCPICGTSLAGKTSDQATVHVNACLDGLSGGPEVPQPPREAPLERPPPTENKRTPDASETPTVSSAGISKRFMRTAQPRPGQANPIAFGGGSTTSSSDRSAFSKLMSGHAEDEAWAMAAASEVASRGRPAYERTCPFYKIMPGFSICVDAFRYGAVEGCRAYFLSHFHSDHYIGLTAKWCHGPIYCSKVTASLVRTQLGTAAQYVVGLDFEETVDVPGIPDVRVTMIPANHCPGSSMFLFEKTMQPTGRVHRILHCGDFRACRAHVDHPLLMPDVVDAVTRKQRHQRIDVCYLDTTYLNPRYAFPPQDDVVAACAALCKTLDQSLRAGEEGEWERALRRREAVSDGSGNVKDFFKRAGTDVVVPEAPDAGLATAPPPAAAVPENALSRLGRPSPNRNRLLVICGTYSIGKERICKAIALALGSKIYASPAKIKIVAQLGDPELTALMTSDATEAQVHMQMLMELRAETLQEYLEGYRGHFSKIVGFRPSGWNYRPQQASTAAAPSGAVNGKGVGGKNTTGTAVATPSASLVPSTLATTTLLHAPAWRSRFGVRDLVPQRGSTSDALCLGVPYSEHSSFRELALFLMALRIDKVVPTVNVGSDVSRKRMKAWIDRWLAERRKGGVVRTLAEGEGDPKREKLWEGKDGQGGVAYW